MEIQLPPRSPFLDVRQAVDFLQLRPSTLNRWRSIGGGPVYLKAGGRVRYLLSDLTAWLESRRRTSTAGRHL